MQRQLESWKTPQFPTTSGAGKGKCKGKAKHRGVGNFFFYTQVKVNQSSGQPQGSEFFFQFYDVAYLAIIHKSI